MGAVTETIREKLTNAFNPVTLDIIDDSEKHRGHGGYREGGESHFTVRISADAFNGQSRVAKQRAVYKVLAEEMKGTIHALALEVEGTE